MDAIHRFTLGDVLREHRRTYPAGTATACAGERWTFPQMDERVNRLASALRTEGVGPGERVLWLGQNCHRLLESLLACAKLGAAFCPANWRGTPDELAFAIEDFDAKVVIRQEEEIGPNVAKAREQAATKALWLCHDADTEPTYEQFLEGGDAADPDEDVDPLSPVLAIYTAAFGGRPNAALLSHLGLILEGLVVGMLRRTTAETIYLNSGPLFHVGMFMSTLATMVFGGTNVLMRRFDAEEFCRIVERERCTDAYVVGPMSARIVEANRDGRHDLKSLRTTAGTPEWNEMITVEETPWSADPGGYGQTEVTGLLTWRGIGPPGAIGAHGRTLPVVQVRVVGPGGEELPPGEAGEIVCRGPTAMAGYHARDEENARRQRDGWHHTHDLGRREEDGSLTFIGPMSAMIKSGVENIYPAEVERCLASHPAVAEACVIGVPDPEWTQSVKAVVVLRSGASATAEDIIEHCRANIASYKKPRTVEFTDALPRDANGMVDRAAVDERYGGGNYPGPSRVRG